jgi:hypothetical protein
VPGGLRTTGRGRGSRPAPVAQRHQAALPRRGPGSVERVRPVHLHGPAERTENPGAHVGLPGRRPKTNRPRDGDTTSDTGRDTTRWIPCRPHRAIGRRESQKAPPSTAGRRYSERYDLRDSDHERLRTGPTPRRASQPSGDRGILGDRTPGSGSWTRRRRRRRQFRPALQRGLRQVQTAGQPDGRAAGRQGGRAAGRQGGRAAGRQGGRAAIQRAIQTGVGRAGQAKGRVGTNSTTSPARTLAS